MGKIEFCFYCILILFMGWLSGLATANYFYKNGNHTTNYCKEIQVDTLQYDYQQNLYKYEIKIIK